MQRYCRARWLGLFILATFWASTTHAAGCEPVIVGLNAGVNQYAAVYSSCTSTSTFSATELTLAIHYSPAGVIQISANGPEYYVPPAPASSNSIGPLVDNKYYSQDMGAGYGGNCEEMTGTLWSNPTAIAGHYYCYRFDGTTGDLFLGASLTDSNTFINATASIIRPLVAPDLTPETDTGVSDNDNFTVDNMPDFYVECRNIGDTVTLYTDYPTAGQPIGSHECSSVGIEVASVTTALAVGIHNITYTYNDGNAESEHSPALAVTIDLISASSFE